MPGGQQREVVLVQVGDRLRIVGLELGFGDLVHPRLHDFAEDLATRLAADRLGDHPDGVLRLDETEWHGALAREQDDAEGRRRPGRNRPEADAACPPRASASDGPARYPALARPAPGPGEPGAT